jgi:uncharacterized membrane protein YhaH (DUF805 family)
MGFLQATKTCLGKYLSFSGRASRPASLLGVTGLTIASVVQLVLAVLMIWWLTRPSDTGDNAYGPRPA